MSLIKGIVEVIVVLVVLAFMGCVAVASFLCGLLIGVATIIAVIGDWIREALFP